jgi:anti-anti-sigma factor
MVDSSMTTASQGCAIEVTALESVSMPLPLHVDRSSQACTRLEVRPIRSHLASYMRASGDIDTDTIDTLERMARLTVRDRSFRLSRLLVLNVAGITSCDADGVSALLRIQELARSAGGRMVLNEPSSAMIGALTLAGLNEALALVTSGR